MSTLRATSEESRLAAAYFLQNLSETEYPNSESDIEAYRQYAMFNNDSERPLVSGTYTKRERQSNANRVIGAHMAHRSEKKSPQDSIILNDGENETGQLDVTKGRADEVKRIKHQTDKIYAHRGKAVTDGHKEKMVTQHEAHKSSIDAFRRANIHKNIVHHNAPVAQRSPSSALVSAIKSTTHKDADQSISSNHNNKAFTTTRKYSGKSYTQSQAELSHMGDDTVYGSTDVHNATSVRISQAQSQQHGDTDMVFGGSQTASAIAQAKNVASIHGKTLQDAARSADSYSGSVRTQQAEVVKSIVSKVRSDQIIGDSSAMASRAVQERGGQVDQTKIKSDSVNVDAIIAHVASTSKKTAIEITSKLVTPDQTLGDGGKPMTSESWNTNIGRRQDVRINQVVESMSVSASNGMVGDKSTRTVRDHQESSNKYLQQSERNISDSNATTASPVNSIVSTLRGKTVYDGMKDSLSGTTSDTSRSISSGAKKIMHTETEEKPHLDVVANTQPALSKSCVVKNMSVN